MERESALSRISIRRVTIALAVVSALFSVLGIVTQFLSISPGPLGHLLSDEVAHLFDLDAEAALPAWFQTGMLLASGALLWCIGSSRGPGDGFARSWKFLAWVFVYISADENARIHETLGFWISDHFGESMGVYAWLIPGIAFVITIGFASWKFLQHLPPAIRRGMFLAAAVYVSGAAGMEVIEAQLDSLWGTFAFSMLVVVEESLEMAGLVIFIHTLLSYMRSFPRGLTITVEP